MRELVAPMLVITEELTSVTSTAMEYVITRSSIPVSHAKARTQLHRGESSETTRVVWTSELYGNRATEFVAGRALGLVFQQILKGCADDLAR